MRRSQDLLKLVGNKGVNNRAVRPCWHPPFRNLSRLLQTGTKTGADGCPSSTLTILGQHAINGCCIQKGVFNVVLVEDACSNECAQLEGRLVQLIVAPAGWGVRH